MYSVQGCMELGLRLRVCSYRSQSPFGGALPGTQYIPWAYVCTCTYIYIYICADFGKVICQIHGSWFRMAG